MSCHLSPTKRHTLKSLSSAIIQTLVLLTSLRIRIEVFIRLWHPILRLQRRECRLLVLPRTCYNYNIEWHSTAVSQNKRSFNIWWCPCRPKRMVANFKELNKKTLKILKSSFELCVHVRRYMSDNRRGKGRLKWSTYVSTDSIRRMKRNWVPALVDKGDNWIFLVGMRISGRKMEYSDKTCLNSTFYTKNRTSVHPDCRGQ
jgi:hypothetical protein